MIQIKTSEEINAMARSGSLLAGVLASLAAACVPGVRTRELDSLGSSLIRAGNATPGFKGYRGFPASICISINDEVIHGIPGRRFIRPGDLVSLDLGLILNGWWADAGLTIAVPPVSEAAAHLLRVTNAALVAGIEQAQVGNHLEDISFAIQQVIDAAGFGIVRSYSGHGVGRALHEEPSVPNYGDSGNGPLLTEGMTLAIEPMVTFGSPEVYVLSDDWTVVTQDHSLSAYAEHTVAITTNGPRILTARS